MLQTMRPRELQLSCYRYTMFWHTRIIRYYGEGIDVWRRKHPHSAFIAGCLLRNDNTGVTRKAFRLTIDQRNSYALIPRKFNKKFIHTSTNMYGIKTRDDDIEVPIEAFWLFCNVCLISKGKDCKNNYRWLANGVT